MAERKSKSSTFSGIYHWSGNEQMTKYMMTCKMAKLFGLSVDHLTPDKNAPTGPTLRPYNTQLHCGKLEELMGDKVADVRTSFAVGITKYLKKFVQLDKSVNVRLNKASKNQLAPVDFLSVTS